MTCDDCPELGSMALKPAVFHIVYTGGTEANFYALAGRAIPPQNKAVMLQYGWPRIEPDGTVIYEGGQEPPAPEGYIRTGPGRFRPAWPSCVYRMLKVHFLDLTGNLDIRAACSNPQSGSPVGKPLTLADCQGCKAREPIRATNRTACE